MAETFLNRYSRAPDARAQPEEATELIDPLIHRLFTPRRLRHIGMVDLGSHIDHVDPPTGPAIVAFFRKFMPGTIQTDVSKPAELIGAQLTNTTGLVTVDWHSVDQLDQPTGPCSPTHCGRLLYEGNGEIKVEYAGREETVELEDKGLAFTALRWALVNLDTSGMAYDLNNPSLGDRDLAVSMVDVGHQLTLPDAPEISHALRLPYQAN